MALMTFLQVEKKAAWTRIRQCENFLAHKIEDSGVLEDPDVHQALFNLRKMAMKEYSSFFRLLTLARSQTSPDRSNSIARADDERHGDDGNNVDNEDL